MAGKVQRGKWRYIAFRVDAERHISRRDFTGEFASRCGGSSVGDRFRLTVFERGLGIVKVPHTAKDEAISVLRSIDSVRGVPAEVTPLSTSGTIRKLKEKYLPDGDGLDAFDGR